MNKAIVFDVDGVLLHTYDGEGNFLWHKNLENDLGISSIQTNDLFFRKYWSKIGIGEMDTLDALAEFLNEINSKVTPQEFLDYWFEKDSSINNEVYQIAKDLYDRGYALYIGTNQETYRVEHLRKILNHENIFKKLYASSLMKCEKPSTEYFKVISRETNHKPEELLFVDDTLVNVESALSLGWHAHHFKTVEGFRESLSIFLK